MRDRRSKDCRSRTGMIFSRSDRDRRSSFTEEIGDHKPMIGIAKNIIILAINIGINFSKISQVVNLK